MTRCYWFLLIVHKRSIIGRDSDTAQMASRNVLPHRNENWPLQEPCAVTANRITGFVNSIPELFCKLPSLLIPRWFVADGRKKQSRRELTVFLITSSKLSSPLFPAWYKRFMRRMLSLFLSLFFLFLVFLSPTCFSRRKYINYVFNCGSLKNRHVWHTLVISCIFISVIKYLSR